MQLLKTMKYVQYSGILFAMFSILVTNWYLYSVSTPYKVFICLSYYILNSGIKRLFSFSSRFVWCPMMSRTSLWLHTWSWRGALNALLMSCCKQHLPTRHHCPSNIKSTDYNLGFIEYPQVVVFLFNVLARASTPWGSCDCTHQSMWQQIP